MQNTVPVHAALPIARGKEGPAGADDGRYTGSIGAWDGLCGGSVGGRTACTTSAALFRARAGRSGRLGRHADGASAGPAGSIPLRGWAACECAASSAPPPGLRRAIATFWRDQASRGRAGGGGGGGVVVVV